MARPFPVEQIEVGDRTVIWFTGHPAPVVMPVEQITVMSSCRALHYNLATEPLEIIVPNGQTVDLAC